MRTLLLGISIFIASFTYAQNRCVSTDYIQLQFIQDPDLKERVNSIESFIKYQKNNSLAQGRLDGNVTFRIPVVVHVLYNSAGQNISDQQILSQIDALNRDFRRKNPDTVNTPHSFKTHAADIHLEFGLATSDPVGRPTTGVVRRHTSVSYWQMDDKIKYASQGGDDAWDSRYYLNIWVGNMIGLLGYSSLPGCSPATDGIVITTSVFGTTNVSAPYNLGRTAVHETGHWLGLKHIWGDTYCGDDLVDDTPKQGNFTSGCPGKFRSSCDNGPDGDMYMNYMDFTDDGCLNLFTAGQKQRMLSLFNDGGPRASLLNSRGLDQPWTKPDTVLNEIPTAAKYVIYPNPAANELTINFDTDQSWINKKLSIINMNGSVIHTQIITSSQQKINISAIPPGIYFIRSANGTTNLVQKFVKN